MQRIPLMTRTTLAHIAECVRSERAYVSSTAIPKYAGSMLAKNARQFASARMRARKKPVLRQNQPLPRVSLFWATGAALGASTVLWWSTTARMPTGEAGQVLAACEHGTVRSSRKNALSGVRLLLRVAWRCVFISTLLSGLALSNLILRRWPAGERAWLRLLQWSLRYSGPAFTKWAQWAAARPDLLPANVRAVLETLHTAAPAHSFQHTRAVLNKSFAVPLTDLFASIEEDPIASGAIAQVHVATLTPSAAARCGVAAGQKVAVKVCHPHVLDNLGIDFTIMMRMAQLASTCVGRGHLRFEDSLEQFRVPLYQQLDLSQEAEHLDRFAANFRHSRAVAFPRPLWPLVAEEVLVETYEQGTIVREYVYNETPYNQDIARVGLDAYLQMILRDNFVHADLHPGNILVRPHDPPLLPSACASAARALFGSAPVDAMLARMASASLVLLDVGMTTSLSAPHMAALTQLYTGLAQMDGNVIADATLQLRHSARHQLSDEKLEAFRSELAGVFTDIDRAAFRTHTQEVVGQVLDCMRRHRLTMDGAASTVLITTLALEGWATKLDPDIRIMDTICELVPAPWTPRISALVGKLVLTGQMVDL